MAVQDLLESLRNFDPNDLSDVNNVGSWPLAVKAIIWTVAFVASLAIGYFMFITPLQQELTQVQ